MAYEVDTIKSPYILYIWNICPGLFIILIYNNLDYTPDCTLENLLSIFMN